MGYMDKVRRYWSNLTFDRTWYEIWSKESRNDNEWTKEDNLFSDDKESTVGYVRLLRKKNTLRGGNKLYAVFEVHNSSKEIDT